MEHLGGKESNDNLPPQVGEWVSIVDSSERRNIVQYLKSNEPFVVAIIKDDGAVLVARRDYKPGMVIPQTVSEIAQSTIKTWGTGIKNVRIMLKPRLISGDGE